MRKPGIISSKSIRIEVCERQTLSPAPGTATARHVYNRIFTVRAAVKTAGGSAEWMGVEIDGKKVTHTFTIRWTSIPFDIRHRVRDVSGKLYQILKVANVDEGNREIRIQCAAIGDETQEAAR